MIFITLCSFHMFDLIEQAAVLEKDGWTLFGRLQSIGGTMVMLHMQKPKTP